VNLLHNQIFLLLLIIIIGELLGKIRIGGLSLGPSAIIFVALVFGHFGVTLPAGIQTIGLAMFIYAIGLQAGPGFLSSFRSNGIPMALTVIAMALTGTLITYLCCKFFGFDAGTGAGILSGAMTSTPSLAAAVEVVGHDRAPAAYGVTYGFGVVGMALFIKLLPRLLRVDLEKEENKLGEELNQTNPPITVRHVAVTNANLFGRRIDVISLKDIAPVTITRLLRRSATEPILVRGDTVLEEGDHLRLVGRETALDKMELFIGQRIVGEIAFDLKFGKRDIVVSKRNRVGATLGGFNLRETFNVQITRVTRSGIDLIPDPHIRLHLGDVLHAVGDERALSNAARLLGNNLKETYNISLLPILAGLLFGLLLGRITLPLPLIGPLTLGATGGTLLSGLLLGALYQTGPVIWALPMAGNRLFRDLGLALFLASVGTSAGTSFVLTLQERGGSLLFSGIVVTLLPVIVGTAIGLWLLRVRFLRLLGVLVGGMTSASGLSSAQSLSASSYAPAAYATVYPVALISKIIAVKVLLMILPAP